MEACLFDINEFIRSYRAKNPGTTILPHVVCADGNHLSVQADKLCKCTPKSDNASSYKTVEVWYSSSMESTLIDYFTDENDNFSGMRCVEVPVGLINDIVKRHGGEGERHNHVF
jgi:hypothetical protein